MLLNLTIANYKPAHVEQETVSTDHKFAIDVPAGFAVEMVENNGITTIRLKPEAEKDIPDTTTCAIERIIEFGAHSRGLFGYAFACHKENVVRENLPKLIGYDGDDYYELLDSEISAFKGKVHDDTEASFGWYIEHLEYICPKDYDSDEYDKCRSANRIQHLARTLSEDLRMSEDWILRLFISAYKKGLMSSEECANSYFSYCHPCDDDGFYYDYDYSYDTEEEWREAELRHIRDTYFPGDDSDEVLDDGLDDDHPEDFDEDSDDGLDD